MKIKKTVILISIFSFLLTMFSSCVNDTASVSAKEELILKMQNDVGINENPTEFIAEPFAQNASLSWVYSINIKVVENEIYLNDIQYGSVELVDNFLTVNEAWLIKLNDDVSDEEYHSIIQVIKGCKKCYLLKIESNDAVSEQTAIYIIDGVYYFMTFDKSNEVIRIHRYIIK